ncbi:MAG TPA: hypothetical protein VFJ58_05460 [Armatimonadota bacterium]|nr:hypothetical protein [Armatimonadota bacterium]
MSDNIVCSSCGARLLSGGAGGKLACPVCGGLLRCDRPTDSSKGQRETSEGAQRSRPLMITVGIIGLALAALLSLRGRHGIGGELSRLRGQSSASAMVGSPMSALSIFRKMPAVDLMRKYLDGADIDAVKDPADCGLHLELLDDWQFLVAADRKNARTLQETLTADWRQAASDYSLAADSPHTRFDHLQLLQARRWLIEFRRSVLTRSSIEPEGSKNQPLRSVLPLDPGPPIQPVLGPATLIGMPVNTLPTESAAIGFRDFTNELDDVRAIEIHYPKDPYGYRKHAEILMKIIGQPKFVQEFKRPIGSLISEARQALNLAIEADHSQTGQYIIKDDERELDILNATRIGGAGIMPVEPPRVD